MSHFGRALERLNRDPTGRRWLYVPYDQLSSDLGRLSRDPPSSLGLILVENPWKADRRPYHRQKLALILANGRHFALEQVRRGVAVRVAVADGPYRSALQPLIGEFGPIEVMRPAERELRADLQPLIDDGGLIEVAHEGWLSEPRDFAASQKSTPPWRMDAFYRHLRRQTGLLMDRGKPIGGTYSFDADNRKPWPGEPAAPTPPAFEPDPITREVADLIEQRFPHHPGAVDLENLPATAADAERLWSWARDHCLPLFGPYEDAMSVHSRGLFHTRIAGLLNIHRLLPARVVADVAAMDLPIASQEGFIRQVLGWREFVHHVHERTDGFRSLPGAPAPTVADRPGDAGWGAWTGESWPRTATGHEPDGGAAPSLLGADRPLPKGFWPNRPTGLACLDRVVGDVWDEAWSHHITRLMVLSNLATLLEVEPRQLTDWFWVAFLDAYDWVVEPNVLAMGSFAVGPLMTTKPYVSGAAYLNRMSDYCSTCAFRPTADCPITNLYWAFLDRHREILADNHRMRLILSSLGKRSAEKQEQDRAVFTWVSDTLTTGGRLRPSGRPEATCSTP
ncbi:MAG: cryptochrome/photolyase family protein [Thermoanaerobaculales bacterium]|nr:cryptochrome/photolyase family protein [Thermoanaerobaculales bacterium]